jgi:hypothetical protein
MFVSWCLNYELQCLIDQACSDASCTRIPGMWWHLAEDMIYRTVTGTGMVMGWIRPVTADYPNGV